MFTCLHPRVAKVVLMRWRSVKVSLRDSKLVAYMKFGLFLVLFNLMFRLRTEYTAIRPSIYMY